MARTLHGDQALFFRALIEELVDGEWKRVNAFGPHVYQNQARDHDRGWYREKYTAGTRRKRVQVQDTNLRTGEIVWRDVD